MGASPDGSLPAAASSPPESSPGKRPVGLIVGMVMSAPYFTSSFIAGTSVPYAALQNAVAPTVFTPSRSKL